VTVLGAGRSRVETIVEEGAGVASVPSVCIVIGRRLLEWEGVVCQSGSDPHKFKQRRFTSTLVMGQSNQSALAAGTRTPGRAPVYQDGANQSIREWGHCPQGGGVPQAVNSASGSGSAQG